MSTFFLSTMSFYDSKNHYRSQSKSTHIYLITIVLFLIKHLHSSALAINFLKKKTMLDISYNLMFLKTVQ